MTTRILLLISVILAVAAVPDKTTAALPPTLSYQGVLTDLAGVPLADGTYNLTVRLYGQSAGGAALWQESQSVDLVGGVFSTVLGATSPPTLGTIDFDQQLWLGLEVDTDGEMTPRTALTATPYSFIAGDLGDGVALRSLNGLTDDVNLLAGSGVTISPIGNDLVLSSTGGGSGADADWAFNGANMYSLASGFVGIGTTTPTRDLEIVNDGVNGVRFGLRDETDPAVQSYQIATMLIATELANGSIGMTTTTGGSKTMHVRSSTPGTDLELRATEDVHLHHISRLRIIRSGDDVAEFNNRDEMLFFADPDGEVAGVMIRGYDPDSGNDGGEMIFNNEQGQATIRLDGHMDGNHGGTIQMHGKADNLAIELRAQHNAGNNGGVINVFDEVGTRTVRLDGENSGNGPFEGGGRMSLYHENGLETTRLEAQEDGNPNQGGVLKLYDEAGNLTVQLDADYGGKGRVITEILEITGGADLSEQFDITSIGSSVLAGHVVCIDPDRPGELKLSERAYDTCVAGVVSGAGGVRPGMLMGQSGSAADGAHPVALTGRVYVQADAASSAIRPGDLLTTSDVPGHAMKVSDSSLAQGAILGKAMTALTDGRGLVLVLVTLQ